MLSVQKSKQEIIKIISLLAYVGKSTRYIQSSWETPKEVKMGIICLCWGFTAQSTQWGHVERGQFT